MNIKNRLLKIEAMINPKANSETDGAKELLIARLAKLRNFGEFQGIADKIMSKIKARSSANH
jgi:hypothetical protein